MRQIRYVLHGIDFEWDERKAMANFLKHGVAFETACEAFFDPFLFALDDEIVEGEARETVVGLTVGWQLVQVVYTWRGETIRLISARPATERESKAYESD